MHSKKLKKPQPYLKSIITTDRKILKVNTTMHFPILVYHQHCRQLRLIILVYKAKRHPCLHWHGEKKRIWQGKCLACKLIPTPIKFRLLVDAIP